MGGLIKPGKDTLIFLSLCMLLGGCEKPYREKLTYIAEWHFADNIGGPDNAPKKPPIRADEKGVYSDGPVYLIPDSLVNKDLRIYLQCEARLGELWKAHAFVISMQKGDSLFYYSTFAVQDYVSEPEKWMNMTDSTQIPGNINKVKGSQLRMYGVNPKGQSYVEFNNVKITLKQVDYIKRLPSQ